MSDPVEKIWPLLNSTFFQSLSILVSVFVAYLGVKSWKEQHVWTRNSELAEELLVAARGFQDAIRRVRSPFSFSGEGQSRGSREGETETEQKEFDHLFVPLERLHSEREVISRMHSADVRSRIRFGERVVESLDQLADVHREVLVAARTRYSIAKGLQGQPLNSETQEILQRKEAVIWSIGEDDPFEKKVETSIRTLQCLLKNYLA